MCVMPSEKIHFVLPVDVAVATRQKYENTKNAKEDG